MNQPVNFYIGALVIIFVGCIATYLIVNTNNDPSANEYKGASASSTNPEIPSLSEELKADY